MLLRRPIPNFNRPRGHHCRVLPLSYLKIFPLCLRCLHNKANVTSNARPKNPATPALITASRFDDDVDVDADADAVAVDKEVAVVVVVTEVVFVFLENAEADAWPKITSLSTQEEVLQTMHPSVELLLDSHPLP